MKRKSKVLTVLLLMFMLCAMASMPVMATETAEEELQRVYSMPVESNSWSNWPQGPGTYSDAAIIMEAGSGAILYAKNIDEHEYPASITKILTALVALENGALTDTVTFSHDSVAFLQPGDSSIGMKEGNQLTLDQALHATLLASANEAAYAVGESVGINAGHDYDWFIAQMNARCKELGGENSNFVNTNGLHDENHYTCARDMALIGRELFKHPEFFEIVQTLQYKIEASDATEEHVFQQKHKMLLPSCSQYYENVIGGKTGYTSDALSTLVTMADDGNLKLICVVLRDHGTNHYVDTKALFDYSFENFQKVSIAENETSEDVEKIIEEDGGYVVLPKGMEFSSLTMELEPDGTTSDEATLKYYYEGNQVGSARAQLSETYIDEHSIKVEDKKEEDKKDSKEKKSLPEKIVLIVAVVILLLLIREFIVVTRRRKQKRRRRRRRRR